MRLMHLHTSDIFFRSISVFRYTVGLVYAMKDKSTPHLRRIHVVDPPISTMLTRPPTDAQCHQTPLDLRVVLLLELLLGALQQGGILMGCPRPPTRPWTQEHLPPLLTSRLATSRHTLRNLGPVLGAAPAFTGRVGFRKGVVFFFGPYIPIVSLPLTPLKS